jgi:hypothetical protein
METIIQQLINLFSNITLWFNSNVGHGFLSFIKSILLLITNILQFIISALNWVINHI